MQLLFQGRLQRSAGEFAVFEVHLQAPAEDHAESEDEEEAGSLLHRHEAVEVAACDETDGGEYEDDSVKSHGALHHDDAFFVEVQARGAEQRVREDECADQERECCPRPRDPEGRDDEHAESGGHT